MNPIPTPWTIGVKRWTQAGKDRHGNPVEAWADPAPVRVHAVAPRVSSEPDDPNRSVVVIGLEVYAPAGTQFGPHDRVVWGDEEFEVDGDIADWSRGPWPNPAA